jgi:hypothetical protein
MPPPRRNRATGAVIATPVLAALSREFYAPIIPIFMDLHNQGLSLRVMARELEQRSEGQRA